MLRAVTAVLLWARGGFLKAASAACLAVVLWSLYNATTYSLRLQRADNKRKKKEAKRKRVERAQAKLEVRQPGRQLRQKSHPPAGRPRGAAVAQRGYFAPSPGVRFAGAGS